MMLSGKRIAPALICTLSLLTCFAHPANPTLSLSNKTLVGELGSGNFLGSNTKRYGITIAFGGQKKPANWKISSGIGAQAKVVAKGEADIVAGANNTLTLNLKSRSLKALLKSKTVLTLVKPNFNPSELGPGLIFVRQGTQSKTYHAIKGYVDQAIAQKLPYSGIEKYMQQLGKPDAGTLQGIDEAFFKKLGGIDFITLHF